MQRRHECPQLASLHSHQRLVGGSVHLPVTVRSKLPGMAPGLQANETAYAATPCIPKLKRSQTLT